MMSAWRILFGASPDVWMLNWRAAQYLNVIGKSELGAFLKYHDSRVTYRLPVVIEDVELPLTAVMAGNGNPAALTIMNAPVADDAAGRMKYDFSVTRDGDGLTVADLRTGTQTSVVLAFANGLSQAVPLGASGVSVAVSDDGEDDSWQVSMVAVPRRGLAEITADLRRLSAEHLTSLFRSRSSEPVSTFYNLWTNSRGTSLSLAAFLLAWAWRAEELRNA
jgi:hypothetical protein